APPASYNKSRSQVHQQQPNNANARGTNINTAEDSARRPSPPPLRPALSPARVSARGSAGPLMPVIPIPRRARSFHGPHTTCMHSACGAPRGGGQLGRATKYNNFDLYLRSRCMYSFLRFLLYFGCSLVTSLLWVALSVLFLVQYAGVRALLRLQYKLSVILLLLGHRRLDFGALNDLFIYSMHVTMFLVGGLGWCFMVFVDM
ncbi:hypothetical protein CRUP_002332, partial [Coryphaenoides rupestris]